MLEMETAFSYSADFSNMVEGPPLQISTVIHKTYLKVDESGTEAAAATAVKMQYCAISLGHRPSVPVMRVDQRFIFLVVNQRTDDILFMSSIKSVDPA
jgi:serpin B